MALHHDALSLTHVLASAAGDCCPMREGAMPVRTVIDRGPKGKRSVAFAVDWPGWSRGAKSAELALETLASYRERYQPVATLAGMAGEFDAAGPLETVQNKVGTGSTDFWGISFSPSATEQEPMGEAELERKILLLRACWVFFDGVAARVSPEMRKGPRGEDGTATRSSATPSAPNRTRRRVQPRGGHRHERGRANRRGYFLGGGEQPGDHAGLPVGHAGEDGHLEGDQRQPLPAPASSSASAPAAPRTVPREAGVVEGATEGVLAIVVPPLRRSLGTAVPPPADTRARMFQARHSSG